MGNLTIATVFVVVVNVMMFLMQTAVIDLNADGPVCYSPEGSVIEMALGSQDINNQTAATQNVLADLPGSEGTVSTSSSSLLVDVFNNILSWMKSVPGVSFVYGVVAAPYNILKCTGLPSQFTALIGVFWYCTTLIVLIAFLWGRE